MNLSVHDLIAHRLSATPGLIAERHGSVDLAAVGWERMRIVLEHLGNPQYAQRTIHIAGSKGKGTTAHLSAALLRAGGLRTGLFTSPHIDQWNERISLTGAAIDEDLFVTVLQEAEAAISAVEVNRPDLGTGNAFELLTAAAMLAFRATNVDIAVVETGLGGRFDSTNHLRSAVTVLTRIEREHVEILGPSLADIVWNKVGILQEAVPVVVQEQIPEVAAGIRSAADETGAPIWWQNQQWRIEQVGGGCRFEGPGGAISFNTVPLPGNHNLANLGEALCACQLAVPDLALTSAVASAAASHFAIPGRFEVIMMGQRSVVLDVAHTPESVANVLRTATAHFAVDHVPVMLATVVDKPAHEILRAMRPWLGRLILPIVHHPRMAPADDLAAAASQLGIGADLATNVEEALDMLRGERYCVATGSFAIVHDLHNLHRRRFQK